MADSIMEGDLVTIHAEVIAKMGNGQCVIQVYDLAPGSQRPLLIASERGLWPSRTYDEVNERNESRGKDTNAANQRGR